VVVVDAGTRVVVVLGRGPVVVVVEVDVVVVGGGLTVSTERKSLPQAVPNTRRRATHADRNRNPARWERSAAINTTNCSGSPFAAHGFASRLPG
jgi:hypothetical protein